MFVIWLHRSRFKHRIGYDSNCLHVVHYQNIPSTITPHDFPLFWGVVRIYYYNLQCALSVFYTHTHYFLEVHDAFHYIIMFGLGKNLIHIIPVTPSRSSAVFKLDFFINRFILPDFHCTTLEDTFRCFFVVTAHVWYKPHHFSLPQTALLVCREAQCGFGSGVRLCSLASGCNLL